MLKKLKSQGQVYIKGTLGPTKGAQSIPKLGQFEQNKLSCVGL